MVFSTEQIARTMPCIKALINNPLLFCRFEGGKHALVGVFAIWVVLITRQDPIADFDLVDGDKAFVGMHQCARHKAGSLMADHFFDVVGVKYVVDNFAVQDIAAVFVRIGGQAGVKIEQLFAALRL